MGDGGPRFYLTLTPVPPDPASAFFLVNTTDYQGAVRAADRAWKYLYANHPEASFKIKRLAMGAVESGVVELEISGPDGDRLLALQRTGSIPAAGGSGRSRQRRRLGQQDRQGRRRDRPGPGAPAGRDLRGSHSAAEHLFQRHRGLDLSRRRQRHPDRAARRRVHLAEPGRPHQRHLREERRAHLAGAGRQAEARLRFRADPPQEPGTDDHGHRPQHLADRRAAAGNDPAPAQRDGHDRGLSRDYRRRDPEERGDEPEAGGRLSRSRSP